MSKVSGAMPLGHLKDSLKDHLKGKLEQKVDDAHDKAKGKIHVAQAIPTALQSARLHLQEGVGESAWMYGDIRISIARYNRLRWSGPLPFDETIAELEDVAAHEHPPRPILLHIPAGPLTPEEWFETPQDAIERLKEAKAAKAEAKRAKEAERAGRRAELDNKFLEKFGRPRPDIRHIVVLMLENRTFDGAQGHFMNERYKSGEIERSKWDADGQDLYSYCNTVEGAEGPTVFPVWSLEEDDPDLFTQESMSIPSAPAGPVEKFHFLNKCTYGVMRPTTEDLERGPSMGGFAQEYFTKEKANMPEDGSKLKPAVAGTCFETQRSPAMHVYRKEQMGVLTELAESFGCSDTHFSSAPCQTWPNRLFASCGTCYGYYNNIPYLNPESDDDETCYFQSEKVDVHGTVKKMATAYDTDTVFCRLGQNDVPWAIYHAQASLAVLTTKLKYQHFKPDPIKPMEEFARACDTGELDSFVWLEPNYDPAAPCPNDMHPPANVLGGQKLIKDVYNTLRSNEDVWKHTLFIVTCDEGVGTFDHVKPPSAVDPVVGHNHKYVCQLDGSPYEMSSNPFERFGTRVPSLLISPFIRPGSVIRPKGHGILGEAPFPFDHTSIIRTAFDLLLGDPDEHLTNRDKVAPSFIHALHNHAFNMGPQEISCRDFSDAPNMGRKYGVPFMKELIEGRSHVDEDSELRTTLTNKFAAMFHV